ncbi:hypothetical protein AAFN86_28260 [Roseomonas sp. CAU 1739]|uniref:hypothetical protein n=1 Tax=Roseomonas sp. CAU 1739 TaxID=3140364 RepID=UPI00325BCA83
MTAFYAPIDFSGNGSADNNMSENLAPFPYGARQGHSLLVPTATPGATILQPKVFEDQNGAYWDFPNGVNADLQPIENIATTPWRPGDKGGHAPGTLFVKFRVTGTLTADNTLIDISFGGSTGTPTFNIYVDTVNVVGWIRTGSEQGADAPIPSTIGETYIAVFTTRAHNDHQTLNYNVRTGVVSSGANTSSSGTSAGNAPRMQFGAKAGGLRAKDKRIYYGGYIDRGLTLAEMLDLARTADDLLIPRIRRLPVIGGAPVTGDLAATLDSDTVAATVSVPIVGTMAATLDNDTVAATTSVAISGNLAATLDSDTVVSTVTVPLSANLAATLDDDVVGATAYPGDGAVAVLGDTPVTLDGDTVASTVTLDLIADLAATLDGDTVAAYVIAGSNGPFTRRRMLRLS